MSSMYDSIKKYRRGKFRKDIETVTTSEPKLPLHTLGFLEGLVVCGELDVAQEILDIWKAKINEV